MLLEVLSLTLPLALLLILPFVLAVAHKSLCRPDTWPVPRLHESDPRAHLHPAEEADLDLPDLLAPDRNDLTAA